MPELTPRREIRAIEETIMNTVISHNLKRTSVRINPQGDIIDARTKQVIQPSEPEYVPPVVETQEQPPVQTQGMEIKVGSKIDDMINKKIEELVAKKVEEALKNL